MFALLMESAIRSLVLGAAVWVGLKAARVRNTHLQMTAWTLVLLAAISMPALMRWTTVPITAPAAPLVRMLPAARPVVFVAQAVRASRPAPSVDWLGILGCCYVAGAILLLARLMTGLALTWRLRRSAQPIPAEWPHEGELRRSEAIAAPVTFGSTILLPADSIDWPPAVRQAVLAHERSHVEHGDFFIQLLASLYRCIFWFNPLAWWLRNRLAELAETRSDEAAIATCPDRPLYAGILLGFAKRVQRLPVAVAMARPATVAKRVELILGGTPLSEEMNSPKKILLAIGLVPLIALAAGCSMHVRAQNQPPSAVPTTPAPPPATSQATSPAPSRTKASPRSYDSDGDSYAIVSGDTTVGMSGSRNDARRAQLLRDKVQGDYIWFERNLKFYYITDAALVERATDLMRPQEELAREQGELGRQQGELGRQQGELGRQQAHATVSELPEQLNSLRMQMAAMREQVGQGELADMQASLGQMQARLAQLQAQVGERQARLGEDQAELGKKQAELGAQQARLGAQQAQLAEQASQQMRDLLDEAVRRGLARPVE